MTQKELSYVEDAIGHECTIIKLIKDFVNSLNDEDLISYMNEKKENHEERKQKLMNLLEEKENE